MSEIRGVDLSSWQSELKDGAVLKNAGISFANRYGVKYDM